jgi:hypothetical protein
LLDLSALSAWLATATSHPRASITAALDNHLTQIDEAIAATARTTLAMSIDTLKHYREALARTAAKYKDSTIVAMDFAAFAEPARLDCGDTAHDFMPVLSLMNDVFSLKACNLPVIPRSGHGSYTFHDVKLSSSHPEAGMTATKVYYAAADQPIIQIFRADGSQPVREERITVHILFESTDKPHETIVVNKTLSYLDPHDIDKAFGEMRIIGTKDPRHFSGMATAAINALRRNYRGDVLLKKDEVLALELPYQLLDGVEFSSFIMAEPVVSASPSHCIARAPATVFAKGPRAGSEKVEFLYDPFAKSSDECETTNNYRRFLSTPVTLSIAVNFTYTAGVLSVKPFRTLTVTVVPD